MLIVHTIPIGLCRTAVRLRTPLRTGGLKASALIPFHTIAHILPPPQSVKTLCR